MSFDFKPFSPKQLDVMRNSTAFINILEGAVRSGKTIASIVAWIDFVYKSPHKRFLMTGSSSDTLYRNVIEDIVSIMGEKRAKYLKSSQGGARLVFNFGKIKKICYCVGAHDARSESRIRGLTIGGWYADEVTLYPESFVKQAINRMSLSGARAFWTSNPDMPSHYIMTDFIEKAAEKRYKHWHFELDDNLALDEEYKERIRNAYAGMWYKRMILGLWVMADGAIYDMWDPVANTFIDEDLQPGFKSLAQFYLPVDYGTQNPMVFLDLWDDGDTIWILREYYYDGRSKGKQKEDKEYADDLVEFVGDQYPLRVIIDPSAASFKVAVRNRGFIVRDADNDVLPGIRLVATLLAKRKIRIHRHNCPNLIKEFDGYVWDEKARDRGEEKPVKQSDHALDALRYYVYTMVKARRVMA